MTQKTVKKVVPATPFSIPKQRKPLNRILDKLEFHHLHPLTDKTRFIDVYTSPTIVHALMHNPSLTIHNTPVIVVDTLGVYEILTSECREKLIDLRNDLMAESEDGEISKDDLSDIVSNYFNNLKPMLKKVIKSWYFNSPDDTEVRMLKEIPEGWEDQLRNWSFEEYFGNIVIIDDISEVNLTKEDIVIIDDFKLKLNYASLIDKYKNNDWLLWSSSSNKTTALIDILGLMGMDRFILTELYVKTRNLKSGIKIDKLCFVKSAERMEKYVEHL